MLRTNRETDRQKDRQTDSRWSKIKEKNLLSLYSLSDSVRAWISEHNCMYLRIWANWAWVPPDSCPERRHGMTRVLTPLDMICDNDYADIPAAGFASTLYRKFETNLPRNETSRPRSRHKLDLLCSSAARHLLLLSQYTLYMVKAVFPVEICISIKCIVVLLVSCYIATTAEKPKMLQYLPSVCTSFCVQC